MTRGARKHGARVAAQLYVHTNTLRYRLQQVEKVTGLNLNRFEDLVQLYLALRLAVAEASD